jgi:cell division protein FtsB
MSERVKIRKRVRVAIGPALSGLAVLGIVGYAIAGPTGLFAWGDYRQAVAAKQIQLTEMKAKERELRNRVALLDHRRADPDMVDELVRRELGVTHPDEVIIPMTGDPEKGP